MYIRTNINIGIDGYMRWNTAPASTLLAVQGCWGEEELCHCLPDCQLLYNLFLWVLQARRVCRKEVGPEPNVLSFRFALCWFLPGFYDSRVKVSAQPQFVLPFAFSARLCHTAQNRRFPLSPLHTASRCLSLQSSVVDALSTIVWWGSCALCSSWFCSQRENECQHFRVGCWYSTAQQQYVAI